MDDRAQVKSRASRRAHHAKPVTHRVGRASIAGHVRPVAAQGPIADDEPPAGSAGDHGALAWPWPSCTAPPRSLFEFASLQISRTHCCPSLDGRRLAGGEWWGGGQSQAIFEFNIGGCAGHLACAAVGRSSPSIIASVAVLRRRVKVLSLFPLMVSRPCCHRRRAPCRVHSSGLLTQHSGSMVQADLVSNGRGGHGRPGYGRTDFRVSTAGRGATRLLPTAEAAASARRGAARGDVADVVEHCREYPDGITESARGLGSGVLVGKGAPMPAASSRPAAAVHASPGKRKRTGSDLVGGRPPDQGRPAKSNRM
jgi:hypothetical protein